MHKKNLLLWFIAHTSHAYWYIYNKLYTKNINIYVSAKAYLVCEIWTWVTICWILKMPGVAKGDLYYKSTWTGVRQQLQAEVFIPYHLHQGEVDKMWPYKQTHMLNTTKYLNLTKSFNSMRQFILTKVILWGRYSRWKEMWIDV